MPILPETGPLRAYAFITLVDSVGLGLHSTGAVLFFTRVLHLSPTFVGLGLTVAAAVGLLASVPAGRVADVYGHKRVLVGLFVLQAVLYALLPLVSGRAQFVAVVSGIALAESGARPVRRAALSSLVAGEQRVRASAYNRAVLNVGVSVGAAGAAFALAVGSRTAYDALVVGDALSFLVAAGLYTRLPIRGGGGPRVVRGSGRPLREPRFVLGALLCGVLYTSAAILDVGLPLQVGRHSSAPRWVVGALLLVNTGLAITLQVRASRGTESVRGAARANRLAGVALLAACVVLPLSHGPGPVVAVAVLVAGTVLLTTGELFSSAGAWGMSYAQAPADQEAEYLGAFTLVSQAGQVAGPALAAVVVAAGLGGWLVAGGVFLLAGLLSPVVAGRAAHAATPAAPDPAAPTACPTVSASPASLAPHR